MSEQDQPRPDVLPTESTPQPHDIATAAADTSAPADDQPSQTASPADDGPSQTAASADDGHAGGEPIGFDWTLVVAIAVGFAVSAGAHWGLLRTAALAIGVYALCVAARWTYRRVRRAG